MSSKKVPITSLLKFLISKGLVPKPDMTKADLCLAFQTLIENQPDYTKPPMQPIQPMQMQSMQSIQMQPMQSMQMQPIQPMQMPVANNALALSQNNNTMHYQSYQAPMQQHVSIKNNLKIKCFIFFYFAINSSIIIDFRDAF